MEHRRHHVRVRDAIGVDEPERLFGVPLVHEHHPDAEGEGGGERERKRGGVVQRPGAEMDVLTSLAVAVEVHLGHGRRARRVPVNALGAPSGARGVEHGGAEDGVVEVDAVLCLECRVVGLEAIERSVEHEAGRGPRLAFQCAASDLSEGALGHQRSCLAVGDDVRGLSPCQVPVDGREAKTGTLTGVDDLGELRPVREEDGHGVTFTEPPPPQGPRQAVGPGIQLGEAALPLRRDERRALGLTCSPPCQEHAPLRRTTTPVICRLRRRRGRIRRAHRAPPARVSGAGPKTARLRPSVSGSHDTTTSIPTRTSSGRQPTMLVIMRTPSARSTKAMT